MLLLWNLDSVMQFAVLRVTKFLLLANFLVWIHRIAIWALISNLRQIIGKGRMENVCHWGMYLAFRPYTKLRFFRLLCTKSKKIIILLKMCQNAGWKIVRIWHCIMIKINDMICIMIIHVSNIILKVIIISKKFIK